MQDWSIPLTVATAAFLLVLVYRVRPLVGWGRQRGASRDDVREARAHIEAAKDERERAVALCNAARLMAPGSAKGLYLRAVRCDPESVQVVEDAVAALAKRPRVLEAVLWRHLATSPWAATPARAGACRVALDALRTLYEGPLRRAARARAIAHARALL